MIPVSPYIPKQMNGAVIQAYAAALQEELSCAHIVIDYLTGLSIDSAEESELEQIGMLLGYHRPLVPEGFNDDGYFLFDDIPPANPEKTGFSGIEGEIGGKFSTTELSKSNYMDIQLYRKLLSAIAVMKQYGITLKSVDMVCAVFKTPYTITFNNDDTYFLFDTIPPANPEKTGFSKTGEETGGRLSAASLFNGNYSDIVVTFTEDIGFQNLWILTRLFYRFATEPNVIIYTKGAKRP